MFKKWDIVFSTRFPETIQCTNFKCRRNFSIAKHQCDYCKTENNVSSIVAKPRPIIVWLDQRLWHKSMAFGIPLSLTNIIEDPYNHMVLLQHYLFSHTDKTYNQPMRAIIHQATRIDGNTLNKDKIIGTITDKITQDAIENKLLDWLF